MAVFDIKIISYPEEAKKLVDIFEDNYKRFCSLDLGLEFVVFIHSRPKNPKTHIRKISGLKAESISYLPDNKELVKMSAENFIYLMAKFGVEIEVKENSDECT